MAGSQPGRGGGRWPDGYQGRRPRGTGYPDRDYPGDDRGDYPGDDRGDYPGAGYPADGYPGRAYSGRDRADGYYSTSARGRAHPPVRAGRRQDGYRGWPGDDPWREQEDGSPTERYPALGGRYAGRGEDDWQREDGGWGGLPAVHEDGIGSFWEEVEQQENSRMYPGPHGRRPASLGPVAHRRDATGRAEGNERLTALTGSVLLALFAAEGCTILLIHRLLTLHFFLGMLLVGPVILKACSTMYRFARYYTGAADYRRKGPPAPLLRVLGPFVLLTSVGVVGTGVMLAVAGPSASMWLFLHKATFVLWFGAMTIHVLYYMWRLPRLVSGDFVSRAGYRAGEVLAGRWARFGLLAAALAAGVMLAMLTVHRVSMWASFMTGGFTPHG